MSALNPEVVARLVRIDARRPAAWLVAAAAAVVIGVLAGRAWPAAAAAAGCGVILASAAGGSIRGGELLPSRRAARLVWPLLGAVVGGMLASAMHPDRWSAVSAVGPLVVGLLVGLPAIEVARRIAALMPLPVEAEPAPVEASLVGGRPTDAVIMATMLVAMAVCYFLVPEHAAWYAVLAGAWFTLLAVPAATLPGGDVAGRRRLVAAAPGRSRFPGTAVGAVALLVRYAAMLGWPAVVAALLGRHHALAWGGPLAAVAALGALTAVAAAAARLAAARHWPEELPLAVTAAAHAVAIATAARLAQSA
ncbi:MAG: hypothetical protein ACKO4T_10640 [Planctomycetaceae bacterium]